LSYGGSALVVNAFAVGVLLNLSRYRAREERARWNVTAPLGMREGRPR
jgi:cell division protein FtsW (lipid II flippase)